jgi:hypothetical protein
LCANPDDADLRAQFEQAQQDILVTMAELRAVEARGAPGAAAAAAAAVVLPSLATFSKFVVGCFDVFCMCNRFE